MPPPDPAPAPLDGAARRPIVICCTGCGGVLLPDGPQHTTADDCIRALRADRDRLAARCQALEVAGRAAANLLQRYATMLGHDSRYFPVLALLRTADTHPIPTAAEEEADSE